MMKSCSPKIQTADSMILALPQHILLFSFVVVVVIIVVVRDPEAFELSPFCQMLF